jgi:hypothetical protein
MTSILRSLPPAAKDYTQCPNGTTDLSAGQKGEKKDFTREKAGEVEDSKKN